MMTSKALQKLIFIGLAGFAMRGAEAQPHPGIPSTVGYLGVNYRDIDAEQAKALKLPEEAGVEVTLLVPGSPAAVAGVRLYDVVMIYNSQHVEGKEQLSRLISETPPGREVRIQVYRNGYPQNLLVKIGSRPKDVELHMLSLGPAGAGAFPDMPVNRTGWKNGLGAEWESVDGQLANALGVKDGGVLVRSVTMGSAADKGGLKALDVIVRVGDAKVLTPTDVSARIRAGRAQSAVVTVVRDRRETTLVIPLDGSRPGE